MNTTLHYEIPSNQKIIYLDQDSSREIPIIKLLKLPFLGWKYKKICQQNNIDVSLSFTNRPNYIALFSKLFGNQSQIIISERSQPSLQHHKGLQGIVNKILISWLYPKANSVIANSRGNTLDLQTSFGVQSIKTVYNPFDLEAINRLVHTDIPIHKNRFTFITVGRLDHGKNHHLLIEAIKTLDAQLWIIGEGALRTELEQQIHTYNLQEKVILLGRQSNPFAYMAKADCFVFGSNHEGFPNVLVEALVCGLPVISTDCPSGPREILAPTTDYTYQLLDDMECAEYGILIPLNNPVIMTKAMHLMMDNETTRNTYTNKTKSRALDFEKSEIIKQYAAILEV